MIIRETMVPAWPGSNRALKRLGAEMAVETNHEIKSSVNGRPKGDLTSFTCFESTVLIDQNTKRIMALTMRRVCLLKSYSSRVMGKKNIGIRKMVVTSNQKEIFLIVYF